MCSINNYFIFFIIEKLIFLIIKKYYIIIKKFKIKNIPKWHKHADPIEALMSRGSIPTRSIGRSFNEHNANSELSLS